MKEKVGTIEDAVMSHERTLKAVLPVTNSMMDVLHKQHARITELENEIKELKKRGLYE